MNEKVLTESIVSKILLQTAVMRGMRRGNGVQWHRRRYFAWHILIVRLCDDGILIKDVMYELRRNDNLDFAAFYGLRSRVDQLTWSTLLLRVRSGLRE